MGNGFDFKGFEKDDMNVPRKNKYYPAAIRLNNFGIFLISRNKGEVLNILPIQVEKRRHQVFPGNHPVFYWALCMLPLCFPRDWKMIDFRPARGRSKLELSLSVMRYFELTSKEFNHLFRVKKQIPEFFGGVELDYDAEPWEIGANILWLMKTRMRKN